MQNFADKEVLSISSLSINVKDEMRKDMEEANYQNRTVVNIEGPELNLNLQDVIQRFFFWGLQFRDEIKSQKLTSYKSKYYWMFGKQDPFDVEYLLHTLEEDNVGTEETLEEVALRTLRSKIVIDNVMLSFNQVNILVCSGTFLLKTKHVKVDININDYKGLENIFAEANIEAIYKEDPGKFRFIIENFKFRGQMMKEYENLDFESSRVKLFAHPVQIFLFAEFFVQIAAFLTRYKAAQLAKFLELKKTGVMKKSRSEMLKIQMSNLAKLKLNFNNFSFMIVNSSNQIIELCFERFLKNSQEHLSRTMPVMSLSKLEIAEISQGRSIILETKELNLSQGFNTLFANQNGSYNILDFKSDFNPKEFLTMSDYYVTTLLTFTRASMKIPFKFDRIVKQISEIIDIVMEMIKIVKSQIQIGSKDAKTQTRQNFLLSTDMIEIAYLNNPVDRCLLSLAELRRKNPGNVSEQNILEYLKRINSSQQNLAKIVLTDISFGHHQIPEIICEDPTVEREMLKSSLKGFSYLRTTKPLSTFFKDHSVERFTFSMQKLEVKLYDFPLPVIQIEKLNVNIKIISLFHKFPIVIHPKIRKIIEKGFEKVILYASDRISIDKLKLAFGLNMLQPLVFLVSSVKEGVAGFSSLSDLDFFKKTVFKKQKTAKYCTEEDENKLVKSLIDSNKSESTNISLSMDLVNSESRGLERSRFKINLHIEGNLNNLEVLILMDSSPYKEAGLILKIEKTVLRVQSSTLAVVIKNLSVEHRHERDDQLIYVPEIQGIMRMVWNDEFIRLTVEKLWEMFDNPQQMQKALLVEDFKAQLSINIPINEDLKNMTVFLRTDFVSYLMALPQLKPDYLLKKKISLVEEQKENSESIKIADWITRDKKNQNYADLLQGVMNYNLNQQNLEHIWMRCSCLEIRAIVCSFQVRVYSKGENTPGLQASIENIRFSTTLKKAALNLAEVRLKHLVTKSLVKLVPDKIEGRIEFFYASFYHENDHLIELKPKALRSKRIKIFDRSISNPANFSKFFMLGVFDPEVKIPFAEYIKNSLFGSYKNLNIQDSNNESTSDIFNKLQNQLNFNINGIFFKIDEIDFESDRTFEPKQEKGLPQDILSDEKIKIDYFCQVTGLKLLFSSKLVQFITKIISEPIKLLASKKSTENPEEISRKTKVSNPTAENGFALKVRNKAIPNKHYVLSVIIDNPEINISDCTTDTQVLLAAHEKSMFIMYNEFLEHDTLQQDLKVNMKVFMNHTEIFAAPSKFRNPHSCHWLRSESENVFDRYSDISNFCANEIHSETRFGIFNLILRTDYVMLDTWFFSQQECMIDFNKPISAQDDLVEPDMWNGEVRITKLKVITNNIYAYFDRVNMDKFIKTIQFFIKTFNNQEMIRLQREIDEKKQEELSKTNKKTLKSFLEAKIRKLEDTILNVKYPIKVFEYTVKSFQLVLLHENKRLITAYLNHFTGTHSNYKGDLGETEFKIKDMKILNNNAPEEARELLVMMNSPNSKQNGFIINQRNYLIDGMDPQNKWKVYFNFDMLIGPLKLTCDDAILEDVYSFFFNANFSQETSDKPSGLEGEKDLTTIEDIVKLQEKEKLQKKKATKETIIELPNYFKRVKFSAEDFFISYRSKNLLFKMKEAHFHVSPTELTDEFCSVKDVMDKRLRVVIADCVQSFVGYKLAVTFKAKQTDDEKRKKEQDRLKELISR